MNNMKKLSLLLILSACIGKGGDNSKSDKQLFSTWQSSEWTLNLTGDNEYSFYKCSYRDTCYTIITYPKTVGMVNDTNCLCNTRFNNVDNTITFTQCQDMSEWRTTLQCNETKDTYEFEVKDGYLYLCTEEYCYKEMY